ncbi:MAG: hypothetical protein ACO1SV_12395 [Fimbriimonas sp.]
MTALELISVLKTFHPDSVVVLATEPMTECERYHVSEQIVGGYIPKEGGTVVQDTLAVLIGSGLDPIRKPL